MLATIVTPNQSTAQFFFLVAAIAAAIAIVVGFMQRSAFVYWGALGAIIVLCLSIGLLFHA